METSIKEIMPILERIAKEKREKYIDCGVPFSGGKFRVSLGLLGGILGNIVTIHVNDNGKIMRIETQDGAFLKP